MKLKKEQQRFIDITATGNNVFLSGGAGTGKSVALRALREELPAEGTFFTAPTGKAAVNIGGRTIHSFSGLL